MKRVLIVSPYFPPVNAADMHRVRMSLPYFPANGWEPIVLAIDPADTEQAVDDRLLETIPDSVPVVRTHAWPARVTRLVGIGNPAIRGFAQMYAAGARILRDRSVDLIFFSTTQFVALALGRLWKARFGVPYVVDIQDPWHSTYYDDKPAAEQPPKYALMRHVHRILERWTLKKVDGVIAVSDAYIGSLRQRYPWIAEDTCVTIPFGASPLDFEVIGRRDARMQPSASAPSFEGVYFGRGGGDMSTALNILFKALAAGRQASERLRHVTLRFQGTAYGCDPSAPLTVHPLAQAAGVANQVFESTMRVPYTATLDGLQRADFLLVIGSDDPQYSASKIYSYILARRPILAVVHERSPLVDIIRRIGAGDLVTFADRQDVDGPAERLAHLWVRLMERLPVEPDTNWSEFAPYLADALTARQCRLFDAVVRRQEAAASVPCID
jgi:hypothetical protein